MPRLYVEQLREEYKPGTRIRLLSTVADPFTRIPEGSTGTVVAVDDLGNILMHWDCGSHLNLIPSEDKFMTLF